jgi:hypothetical protein
MNAMTMRGEMARIENGRPTAAWLIVVTKGGKERSVCDRLMAQGFEVYCPMRPLPPATAKRRGITAVPLFPRVVFARATLDAYRWQAMFSTIGVSSVMCDPMNPRGLKPEFVEAIRARSFDAFMAIGLLDPSKPPPAPKVKDRRQWVNLRDCADGLYATGVDEVRKSLLVSLLNEGHSAVTQKIPRQ